LARDIENPKAVNLIVLGFALAAVKKKAKGSNKLFCTLTDIKKVLNDRFGGKKEMLNASLKALEAGYSAAI
jgi:hypothetical protein